MIKMSIEIGHIYQDMDLDSNYLEIIKNSIGMIQYNRDFCNYKILVDDLNIKEKKWNENDLIVFLEKNKIIRLFY